MSTKPVTPFHIALTFAVLLLASAFVTPHVQAARRPNVVVIMADDLGYEGLACNGGTSYKTPRLDALAAKGMRFTNCYSQPVCTPSRNKIMTGRSNARNYRAFGVMIPTEITFGHVMKEAGYKTCIAGKWQLDGKVGDVVGTTPLAAGFDESCMWAYSKNLTKEENDHYKSGFPATGKFPSNSRFWKPAVVQNGKYRPTTMNDFGPDIYTKFITDFIETNKDEEFFVYFPMALTHSPFIPTPHTKGLTDDIKFSSKAEHFEGMIQYTGVIVDRIIAKLESLGLAENTLVIFTCDNGTGRGLESHMGDRLIMGAKALAVDAGNHEPMIAYWKGVIEPGAVCNDMIDFSDFLPTVAEIGKAKIPTDRVIDGRSFLPQLKGQKGNPRNNVIVHYDKDPASTKPKFRRVRYAYDGRFKLYIDGSMFEVPQDWDEQSPLQMASASRDAKDARIKLQSALDQMPNWNPDNSTFKGKPDPETQKRMDLTQRVLKKIAAQ